MLRARLDTVQMLRGVAALSVLLYHAYDNDQVYGGGQLLGDAFILGALGVDLFFIISGFVMVYVAWDRWGEARYPLSFILHRLVRIYPLYWLVTLPVFFVWLFDPSAVLRSQGYVDVVGSFLLLPGSGLPLVPVGWTLVWEIYFYLVFFSLLFLPRHWLTAGLGIWSVSVVLFATVVDPGFTGRFKGLLGSPFVFEFVLGCLLALLVVHQRFARPVIAGAAALLLFVASAVVYQHSHGMVEFTTWNRVLFFALPLGLGLYGMVSAEALGQLAVSKVWIALGDASFAIYLTHILWMLALARLVWVRLPDLGLLDNALFLALSVSGSLLLGLAVHHIVERPLLRCSRAFVVRLLRQGCREAVASPQTTGTR